jgi:hypothetical protein
MGVEAVVCLSDQLTIKPLLADSRLVASYQQDRLSLGVKGKCQSPFAACGA